MSRALARGWLVEPALAALTAVVVVGMTRLFADTTFLGDTLGLALLSHLTATAARRAGLGVTASALVSATVGVLAVTALLYPETASYLALPASATIDAVRADLNEAWVVFNEESAPVPVVTGFVAAAGALLWVLVFVADWAAHRLESAVEAVLPAFMVFVFTVVLGTGDQALGHAVAFSAAATAVMVAMRAARQARRAWIEPGPGRGPATVLRAGAGAGAVAVLAGAVIGPSLPGAGAEALIDLTDLEPGPQRRVVVSPLVQVRAKLVEQSDIELFSVAVDSGDREYWRLMALDEFDGDLWRARSSFDDAAGPLPSDFDPSVTARRMTQEVTVASLGNIFLPAAHEVREVIDDGGVAMEYEPASGSLVKTRVGDALGPRRFTYVVESAVPEIDARRLRGASAVAGDFLAFNTALPAAFPASVRAEAERVAGAAGAGYDRALALQDYFRDPGRFRYDLNVAFDQDLDDLESFLFDVRAGYCEQFAAAFASMARSVGLPARVAVGFTWGEWDAARGAYAVRGEHAHAWPEVYFAGTGWVRFEPTPGRGGPNDYGVTGVPPAQEGSQPEPAAATTTVPVESGSGFAGTGAGSAPPAPTAPAAPDDRPGAGRSPLGWRALAYAGAAAAALMGAVPGLRLLQRRYRRARTAHDPRERIELAWAEALQSLGLVDIRHLGRESPLELAARAGRQAGTGPVEALARCLTLGRYSPQVPERAAAEAEASARAVAKSCRRRSSFRRRLAAFFDPRTLLTARNLSAPYSVQVAKPSAAARRWSG